MIYILWFCWFVLFASCGYASNTDSDYEDATHLFLKGRRAYMEKKYPLAKSYFEDSVRIRHNYSDAHMGLGMVHVKLNDPETSYFHFNKATLLDPNNEAAAQNAFTSLNDMKGDQYPSMATRHIEESAKLRIEKAILSAKSGKKDTCSNGWSIFNSLQSKVYNSTILSKECQIRDDLENCLRYQMHHLDYFNNIYLEGHSGIMYSESACSFYLRTSHGVMSGFPSRHFLLNRAKTTLRFHDGVGSIIQTSLNNYYHFLVEGLPRLLILLDYVRDLNTNQATSKPTAKREEITHLLLPDTSLMNETLAHVFQNERWASLNFDSKNVIYYRPGRFRRYHFEHLYTVDWNGLKKVKTGRFMALHRKTKHYSVFANHEHWERLIDAYPISYYFPYKKNVDIVRWFSGEILRKRYEEMYRQGKNAGSMEASIDARGSANITISANLQIGKSTAPETEEINICYVSRNDTRRRVVLKEIVVINMIRRKFDNVASLITIVPSIMSIVDQIRLFQQCSIIIGPHGAGLTNMLFTNSSLLVGLIVFPIVSETENTSYYKHLADTLSVGDNITFIFTQTFNSTRTGNFTGLVSMETRDEILGEIETAIASIIRQ